MKPANPDPDETRNLLRQQLILAQVRIMELEDVRDEMAPRLTALEKLLAEAQVLADGKIDEAAHLDGIRAGLQQQLEHLRHVQHVTNQALEETRGALAAASGRESLVLSEVEQLQKLIATQASLGRDQLSRIDELARELTAAQADATARLARMNQLDAEQRAMKASRSWRWTAWLRSIERAFGPKR